MSSCYNNPYFSKPVLQEFSQAESQAYAILVGLSYNQKVWIVRIQGFFSNWFSFGTMLNISPLFLKTIFLPFLGRNSFSGNLKNDGILIDQVWSANVYPWIFLDQC